MKVLQVITGLTMGGAERVVADLADAQVKGGHDVRLVYLKGPLQVRPRRAEVELTCLDMNSAAALGGGYARFRRIVREFKPDVVHTHMLHATLLARLVRISTPMPCLVSTMHTAYDGPRYRSVAYRVTDRLSDISTNVSVEAVESMVANGVVRPERMIPIYNGIKVDEFRPDAEARARVREQFGIGPGTKLLFAAGRLENSKDYPNMFAALARLPADLDYQLLIAGQGNLRPMLEAMVEELGLASRVRFLGVRNDIPALMAAADVYVLSSSGEGFGLVVAEAMASECIVVATDSGGVREVLGDGGLLVPRRDSAALADALRTACAMDPGEAAALGRRARRRVVETYSFDRAMEKWEELYGRLLGRGQSLAMPRSAVD